MFRVDARPINVLSLCTGAGGLDIGLGLAVPPARVVCCVEHEAYACEVLATRMAEGSLDVAPVWTDIRTFNGRPWRSVVDWVIGGYPCQPFSDAGKRRGADDPRHLWPHIARIVEEAQPSLCFFENVSGHLSLGFREVAEDLERMDFEVAAGLYSASEVGAPHNRKRLFIMAHARYGRQYVSLSTTEQNRNEPENGIPVADGSHVADPYTTGRGLARPDQAGVNSVEAEGGLRCRERSGHAIGRLELCGGNVVNAKGVGRGKGRAEPIVRSGRSSAGDASRELPAFPPGPTDIGRWREILAADPTLEPAIRGMAPGLAHRVGRLRLAGNGVVPLQAAYAFVSLWACLFGAD